MKLNFTTPELEMILLSNEDIITTSYSPEDSEPETQTPIGPGGDINLPFDPF